MDLNLPVYYLTKDLIKKMKLKMEKGVYVVRNFDDGDKQIKLLENSTVLEIVKFIEMIR